MTSRTLDKKDRLICSHGRHRADCKGPRDARHMKTERQRCTSTGHVRGCKGASDRHHVKLTREQAASERERQRKTAARATRKARTPEDDIRASWYAQKEGTPETTHPVTDTPVCEHGTTPLNDLRAQKTPPSLPNGLKAFAGVECPCVCHTDNYYRDGETWRSYADRNIGNFYPFGHSIDCAEFVLEVANGDDGYGAQAQRIQDAIADKHAFLSGLRLAALHAGQKDKGVGQAHESAGWSDTPCLCDAHYPEIPAWKMTRKGSTVGAHRHRDRDGYCTICGAEADKQVSRAVAS